MGGLERFQELATQAQGTPAPPVDVAAQVLLTLRTREVPVSYIPLVLATSGVSLVLAALMAVVGSATKVMGLPDWSSTCSACSFPCFRLPSLRGTKRKM